MSYFLKVDLENLFGGSIKKLYKEGEDVLYQVPLSNSSVFEELLTSNKIPYKWDSFYEKGDIDFLENDEEKALYLIPYNEFEFTDADVVPFEVGCTFLGAINKLYDAIETTKDMGTAVEYSTHPNYKRQFEGFLVENQLFFDLLSEDQNNATYMISYTDFTRNKDGNIA